jgi:hypothetical protein
VRPLREAEKYAKEGRDVKAFQAMMRDKSQKPVAKPESEKTKAG